MAKVKQISSRKKKEKTIEKKRQSERERETGQLDVTEAETQLNPLEKR
jgi:hypothetical protein